MADRRMFSLGVIDTDGFGSLPLSAQGLYFQLAIRADDDGFVKSPKLVQRAIGASEKLMRTLADAGYIIRFESGVIAITHWKLMNKIRIDRYKPTLCRDEIAKLASDGNGAYILLPDDGQTADGPQAQVSPAQGIEGKIISAEERSSAEKSVARPYAYATYGKNNNVMLTGMEYASLKRDIPNLEQWIDMMSDYIATGHYGRTGHATLIRGLAKK